MILAVCCKAVIAQPPAPGAVPQSGRDFQFTVHFASESGLRALVPERWASLDLSLVNGRAEPRQLLCTSYFGENSQQQFGRDIWLPAKSVLRISHPMQVPSRASADTGTIAFHSLVIDRSTSDEVVLRGGGDGLRSDADLILARDARNTGVYGPSYQDGEWLAEDVSDLAVACRVSLQMSNSLTWFRDDFLPADESGLDPLDHVIIADDRILHDLAAIAALRRWMQTGGHVWVMLDRVDARVLEVLLGDDYNGTVIDRTSLTSVRVDEPAGVNGSPERIGDTATYEIPVDFVYLDAGDFQVSHRVNGWPAAMTMPCGDGLLLVTTLGARGWVRPHAETTAQPTDDGMRSNFRLTPPMSNVADEFFRLRKEVLLKADFVRPQAEEYIGYSIPTWSLVVGTLSGFSLCVILIGLLLLRYDRLEQIFWAGTIPALAVSAFLIQTGLSNRKSIPGTVATVQMIQASRGTDDLRSDGVISVYHPDGSDALIAASRGGRLVQASGSGVQNSLRLVTTDIGKWQWESLRQTAGVQTSLFTRSELTTSRLLARATFNSEGMTGQVHGLFSSGADAMVASRAGRMGVNISEDGRFNGGQTDVFETDQFLSAGLLSDEQDRRRRSLKELLQNPDRADYPHRPQLFLWTATRDNGFFFGDGLKQQGASLVSIPLFIQRPPAGTEILIPSPFLQYFNRPSPDGTPSSALWDSLKKQWQQRSEPGTVWLRLPVPGELLPISVTEAVIDLKVTGPIGVLEVLGLRNGSVTQLQTLTNPVGGVTVTISDVESLRIDDSGNLVLGISAGVPTGAAGGQAAQPSAASVQGGKANYWKIESMAVHLRAQVLESASKE